MSCEDSVKSVEVIIQEITQLEKSYMKFIRSINFEDESHTFRIRQADWYVRGSLYHLKNISEYYKKIGEELSSRVLSILDGTKRPPEAVIMYSPEIQYLYFEFYSLVNLVRISLDNLRNLLSPTFSTSYKNLPKSITRILKGETDCPIYLNLAKNEALEYLIDLRNCIVHYRSFATSDNSFAVLEGTELSIELPKWYARISYRQIDERNIVSNIFLPDQIYIYNANGIKKMPPFTYKKKINLLSVCKEFVMLCMDVTIDSIKLLENINSKVYYYR